MGILINPIVTHIWQPGTHRLILSEYRQQLSLKRVSDDDRRLSNISDLETAVDDDPLTETDSPLSDYIVKENFAYSRVRGSRFNNQSHGAWYAGFELETAQAEVAWHKWTALNRIGQTEESLVYTDFLADFLGNTTSFARMNPIKHTSIQTATPNRKPLLRNFSTPAQTESSIPACATVAAPASPASIRNS